MNDINGLILNPKKTKPSPNPEETVLIHVRENHLENPISFMKQKPIL
jgi:hypothetical protein